jgi:tetratricopeptide (TPR) repeat protein
VNPNAWPPRPADMRPSASARLIFPLAASAAIAISPALQAERSQPAGLSADSLEALLAAAEREHYAGRLDAAREVLVRAERAAAEAPDSTSRLARVWVARGLVWLSQTTATNHGYPEADTAAVRALALAEQSGDSSIVADAAELAGRVLYARRINLAEGDYAAPRRHYERALALRRAARDTGGIVEGLFRVGLIHERQGEGDRAIALYHEALGLAGQGHLLPRSNLARHLGYQHLWRGELDSALVYLRESHELRERVGFVLLRPPSLAGLAEVFRRMERYAEAREYAERALAEAERLEASRFVVQALITLGEVDAATSRPDAARRHWQRAETVAGGIGYVSGARQARELLARSAE